MIKVLVINGSPRGLNSSTMKITKAFLEGISESVEINCEEIILKETNIVPCRGCLKCINDAIQCVIRDDMDILFKKYVNADLIIWSFPLYNYSMPAKAKSFLDRTLPINKIDMTMKGPLIPKFAKNDIKQKRVVIVGSGFPNFEDNFSVITKQFELVYDKKVEMICVCETPLFNVSMASYVTRPYLDIIKQAGRDMVGLGVISEETKEKIKKPMIPKEDYEKIYKYNY